MIREIKDPAVWNNFVASCTPNTFLHAWEWGQVQKATGEKIHYLGWYSGVELAGVALVITVNARRGRHYLIPHGPLVKDHENMNTVLSEIIGHVKTTAADDHVVALRIAPLIETSEESKRLFRANSFRPAPLHLHAELTWVVDISKPEPELLAGMRKTTRHAITKAQRAGVTTEILTNPDDIIRRFWPLYEQTRDRHGFVLWSEKMVRAQLNIFHQSHKIFCVIARHNNQDVAAAILPHFGETVYYYHGASTKLPSSIPAAQLLQWTAMQEAKKRGARTYNFWGIAPADKPNHPFAGITTFKKGFGGYEIDYLRAQDLPLSLGYWPLWAVDTFRKFKRGF